MADEIKKFLDAEGLEHVLEEVKEWCEEDRVAITNAVILQEKESQQVIHNFTETNYVKGNKIGYGDVSNKIVVCGYNFLYIPTLYIGTAVDTYYSVMEFPTVRSQSKTVNWSNYKVEARLMTVDGTGRKTYQKVVSYIDEKGTERTYYYDSLSTDGFCALVPVWEYISSAVDGLEYGYAYVEQIHFVAIKDGIVVNSQNFPHYDNLYISFSTEAEYNAAVGLTNTPIELIELKDFQYLVPESQIIVDKELSPDSDNPIANSAVAKALSNIPQFLTTEEINGIINEVVAEGTSA
jgi:hypothetical protein